MPGTALQAATTSPPVGALDKTKEPQSYDKEKTDFRDLFPVD